MISASAKSRVSTNVKKLTNLPQNTTLFKDHRSLYSVFVFPYLGICELHLRLVTWRGSRSHCCRLQRLLQPPGRPAHCTATPLPPISRFVCICICISRICICICICISCICICICICVSVGIWSQH